MCENPFMCMDPPAYTDHGVPRVLYNSPAVCTQPLPPVYTQPLTVYTGIPCTNAQIPGTRMDTSVHSCHRHPHTYSQTGPQVHGSTHTHAWHIPAQGPM